MTIETSKLFKLIESMHDALLEIQVNGDTSKLHQQMTEDFADITFQRGYLMGVGRVLACEGVPAFLSGEEASRITAHLRRIRVTFPIIEKKEAAHG